MITPKSLVLVWLLSLAAGSTAAPGPGHTSMAPLTEETWSWRSAGLEASTLNRTSDVADSQQPSEPTGHSSTRSPEAADGTMPSESTGTTAEPPYNSTAPPTGEAENQTSDSSSGATWMATSPGQNQSTEQNATASVGPQSDPTSASPSRSSELLPSTPTQPVEDESTRTDPTVATTDDVHSTLPSTTEKAPVRTPRAKTGKDRQGGTPKKWAGHGTVVASIIGGALVLMIIGFIAIYVKKRKYKKQQVSTKDWAGPSPFLENNPDDGNVNLRSSNRISVSSFLPRRLSRKLSLLPEEDQELDDIMTGTTFGGNREASEAKNGVQESNGTAAAAGPEGKSTGGGTGSSSQSHEAPSTDTDSTATDLNQDDPAKPSAPSGPTEDSPA